MKEYSIGYNAYCTLDRGIEEMEVQFSIVESTFEEMFFELYQLFNDFCRENKLIDAEILYIDEVVEDDETTYNIRQDKLLY